MIPKPFAPGNAETAGPRRLQSPAGVAPGFAQLGGLYSSACNIWKGMSFSGKYYSEKSRQGPIFRRLLFTD